MKITKQRPYVGPSILHPRSSILAPPSSILDPLRAALRLGAFVAKHHPPLINTMSYQLCVRLALAMLRAGGLGSIIRVRIRIFQSWVQRG